MPDLTEQLRALVADWRDQAKRLRNEVPNLRDGTDKRFAAACDADQAADELSALLAAAEGVERDGLVGELVEMGDDDSELRTPRLLIHTTRDAIRACKLIPFRYVRVTPMRDSGEGRE